MDLTSRGIAWIGRIGEKLESLCGDVDLDVERQLEIAGANVKQFCSEFVQEIFSGSSSKSDEDKTSDVASDQNKKSPLPDSEISNEEPYNKELPHSKSSSSVFPVESASGAHIDSSLQPRDEDIFEKGSSFGKSSGTLNTTPLPCTTIAPVESQEYDPSMQLRKSIDFADLEADISSAPPLICSTYSTESEDSAFSNFDGTNSSATLPVVSNGPSLDYHVNEPGCDLVPEVEFDGNCVLVDRDDFSPGSEFHGAHLSQKENKPKVKVMPGKLENKEEDSTVCEDLRVESQQSNAECKTQSSPNEELIYESDWEII